MRGEGSIQHPIIAYGLLWLHIFPPPYAGPRGPKRKDSALAVVETCLGPVTQREETVQFDWARPASRRSFPSRALMRCCTATPQSPKIWECVSAQTLNHHFRSCSSMSCTGLTLTAFRHLPLSVCPRVWNQGASGMTTFRVGDAVRHAGWSAVDDIVFTRNKWFLLGLAAEFKFPS